MAGSAPGRFLLPLLHLVNHDGAAPNVAVERDSAAGVFKGVALRDIAAGEQVTYRRVLPAFTNAAPGRLGHRWADSTETAACNDAMWYLTGLCDSAVSSWR